jgi:hypothetical protein
MDMSIEKMLSHVYEIEGLMLVTRRLGEENTPDIITNKIQRKVRELAEMCGVTLPSNEPAAPPVPPVAAEPAEPTENAEPAEHLPEDDYDADETWQHDNGEEFKEVFALDYSEPEHEETEEPKVPVEDREPDDDITVEFIEAPDDEPVAEETAQEQPVEEQPVEEQPVEEQPVAAPVPPAAPSIPMPPVFRHPDENDEPVPDPDPAIVPEAEDEPDITVEFIEAEDDSVPEPEDEMPMPPLPTEFPEVDETPAGPMRVDEKLQRSMSKDIRKAFSVNDRFRFQRELFAGSASAMNTAIEHIEMMSSYGNAELYFFSQLHWDRDNESVKEFMAIVRNHFQK